MHESFISYAQLKIYAEDHLNTKIASGQIEVLEAVTTTFLERINAGVTTSPFAAPVYRKFLANAA